MKFLILIFSFSLFLFLYLHNFSVDCTVLSIIDDKIDFHIISPPFCKFHIIQVRFCVIILGHKHKNSCASPSC